jgi:hypothetical protein
VALRDHPPPYTLGIDGAELGRINLATWEPRAPIHAASETHGRRRYVTTPAHVSGVVAFDAPHLGSAS